MADILEANADVSVREEHMKYVTMHTVSPFAIACASPACNLRTHRAEQFYCNVAVLYMMNEPDVILTLAMRHTGTAS